LTCMCRMHRAGRTWPIYGAMSPRARQKAKTIRVSDSVAAGVGTP
jgi:hypothetical protein